MYKHFLTDEPDAPVKCICRVSDGAMIPFDPANTDYQKYLEWVAEGNTPDPAE